MRRIFSLLIVCALIPSLVGCKKKYRNMVPIEQFNSDTSNNYHYIFRKNIEDEKKRDGRYKPNQFKD